MPFSFSFLCFSFLDRVYYFPRICQVSWAAWPANPRGLPAFITSIHQMPGFFPLLFLRTKHRSCCLWGKHFPEQAFPQTLAWEVWLLGLIWYRCGPVPSSCPNPGIPAQPGLLFGIKDFLCELAFNVQSLGMSWNGVALIIHTAEGKENDLCCKK